MKKHDNVTIIIVSYKSKNIIDECLKNIYDHYPIIIIDNDSKDSIGLYLEEKYPDIEFIRLENNIGFGRANNIALNKIDTDFALVLNPDAIITSDVIEEVTKIMQKYIDIVGLASPIIFNSDDHQFLGIEQDNKNNAIDFFENEEVVTTNFVSGCCAFFNMKIMRKIGFFDENIFMYYEDKILSDKVMQSGYKNIIVKKAKIIHGEGKSSDTKDSKENSNIALFKIWHYGWSSCYYNKINKHHSNIRKILSAMSKIIRYKLVGNKLKYQLHKSRLQGFIACLKGISAFDKKI